MTRFFALLVLALLTLSGQVFARGSVPIVNYDDVQIVNASGKPMQLDAVKKAINVAAASKGWVVVPDGEALSATLVVRSKHTVVVGIVVTADKYFLRFKDATNMNLTEHEGQKLIHPFYNKWVLELNEAIRMELLKL